MCVSLQHILFLDTSKGRPTIGYESLAVRNVAAALLNDPQHVVRVELTRALLELQRTQGWVDVLARQPFSMWAWLADATGLRVSDAAAAASHVRLLRDKASELRRQLESPSCTQ